ncbi:NAD(P)-binding protein [Aspergillus ambiguus]|uniref:NAD(P)-binding protein n=1 Tax=Aspergillus ambiguus TaxID=176160 RepID=UPI003CCE3ED2
MKLPQLPQLPSLGFLKRDEFDVNGKLVVIAGGSKGLGKAMALELAAKGANLLLLARSITTLRLARQEIQGACVSSKQIIDAISVDLTQPEEITRVLSHYHPPDILICTAGSNPHQAGFLAEISPEAITSCMELNYYTTVFIVQCCLRLWLRVPHPPSPRHIVLTSSTAAFLGLPGYDAYTPAKVAIRALADTLRQEVLLYGRDVIRVHCSFPGPFSSSSYLEGHDNKPELLEMLEGTPRSRDEVKRTVPSPRTVAQRIISGLEKGKTYIPVDFQTELLLNNMRGPSPRFRWWALWEFLLGIVAAMAWWWFRRDFDRKTLRYGESRRRRDSRV